MTACWRFVAILLLVLALLPATALAQPIEQISGDSAQGAFNGAGKAALIWGLDELRFQQSQWDSISSGDWSGAIVSQSFRTYAQNEMIGNILWNHGLEIAGAFAIGVVAGALIAVTGGMDSPLILPLAAYGIALILQRVVNDYGPALNKLNKDASVKQIVEGKLSPEANADVTVLREMGIVDSADIVAGFAGGGVGGKAGGAIAHSNTFMKPFSSGAKFTKPGFNHFARDVREGPPKLSNGKPNTRLNQVKQATGLDDAGVRAAMDNTISNGKPAPYKNVPSTTNHVKTFDWGQMTVGVDKYNKIATVIVER